MVITVVTELAYCKKCFCIFPACSSHLLKSYFVSLLSAALTFFFFIKLLFLSRMIIALLLEHYTMYASYDCNDNAIQFPCLEPILLSLFNTASERAMR